MNVQEDKNKPNPYYNNTKDTYEFSYIYVGKNNPYIGLDLVEDTSTTISMQKTKTSFEQSLEGEQVWPPRTLNVRNFVKLPVTGEIEMFEVPVNPSPAPCNKTEKST